MEQNIKYISDWKVSRKASEKQICNQMKPHLSNKKLLEQDGWKLAPVCHCCAQNPGCGGSEA